MPTQKNEQLAFITAEMILSNLVTWRRSFYVFRSF